MNSSPVMAEKAPCSGEEKRLFAQQSSLFTSVVNLLFGRAFLYLLRPRSAGPRRSAGAPACDQRPVAEDRDPFARA